MRSLLLHLLLIGGLVWAGLLHCGAAAMADLVPVPEPTAVPRSAERFEAIPAVQEGLTRTVPDRGTEPILLGGSETVHRVNGGWILLRVQEWLVPDPEALPAP